MGNPLDNSIGGAQQVTYAPPRVEPSPVVPGFSRAITTVTAEEATAKIAARRSILDSPQESDDARRKREVAEADVTAAARRSQAEIRRHVDSYLKEYFEHIVKDVTLAVVQQVHDRIQQGISSLQENQQIELDRIAGDLRLKLDLFHKSAWGVQTTPAKRAQRASPPKKGKARASKRG